MQQQIVEQNKIKDRRPGKGRAMALSRLIYRLQNTNNMYYVESETLDDQYYLVKFKPDVLEYSQCSCKDNSMKGQRCKHWFAIEFALKCGTIKEIDKLPLLKIQERIPTFIQQQPNNKKSYLEDDYDF